jgi:signal transduction histidine kinase
VVFADENMLKTVIRNLVSNGIKFTNLDGEILIQAVLNQCEVEITVSDNGVGMNEETSNNLFRIDSTVRTTGTANERGSGFGLILCKEFVEHNGGKIWVKSKIGKGSKFIFTLPVGKNVE